MWEEEQDTHKGDDAEEDGAQWALPARRLIYLASSIPAKGRQRHETPAHEISDTQGDEFAVRAQLDAGERLLTA